MDHFGFVLRALLIVAPFAGVASQASCPTTCPSGWKQLFGGGTNCYIFPPVEYLSFWEMQDSCKAMQPTSYIINIQSYMENTGAGGAASAAWFSKAAPKPFYLWVGAYWSNGGWRWLDGTPYSWTIMKTNTSRPPKDGDCAYVDQVTLANWLYRPCTDSDGVAACEMTMPKCGATPGPAYPPDCMQSAWADYVKHATTGYMDVAEAALLTGHTLQSCSVACMYYTGCMSFDFKAITHECRILVDASSAMTCSFTDDPVGQWQHYDIVAGSAFG